MIWLVLGAVLIVVGLLIAFDAGGSADSVVGYERRTPGWVSSFNGRWAGICLVGMGAIFLVAGIGIVSS
jgi:hypothetical protein